MIDHSKTKITISDTLAVIRVLFSGQVNDSHISSELAEHFSRLTHAAHARVTCSGTMGLVRALYSLGTNPGTHVFTSAYVCEDIVEAILVLGAIPVFVDVDARSFNLCPEDFEKRVGIIRSQGRHLGPVVVPHMFGCPADIRRIVTAGLPVIEDLTHSLGERAGGGEMLGSFGDACFSSLQALKVVTAGEGGVVSFRHRPSRELAFSGDHLSNLNSALAISQFSRLTQIRKKREQISRLYETEIYEKMGGKFRLQQSSFGPFARFRVVGLLEEHHTVERVMTELASEGIVTRRPVKKLLESSTYSSDDLPVARRVFATAVSLPAHLHMSATKVRYVVKQLCKVLQ